MKKSLVLFTLYSFLVTPLWAETKAVTLSVPDMSCAACPITVKKALLNVDGVIQAKVGFEKREATITFDDAKTNPQALIQATTDAGYASRLVK